MKKIAFLAMALLAVSAISAKERSQEEMLAIARQQLATTYLAAKGFQCPQATEVSEILRKESFSVFGNQEQGFVVISRDDTQTTVLADSPNPFPDVIPDGLQWWMDAVNEQLQAKVAANIPVRRAASNYTVTENFITTTWGQESPLNSKAPLVDGTAPYTGCVATAMAQILYYFRYPAQGKGEGWYTFNGGKIHYHEDISTVYRWDLMRDSYSGRTYTDEETDAIGSLLFDCGLAANMDYAEGGSGAYPTNAAAGLVHNFQYDSLALKLLHRDYYVLDEWMDLIYNELNNLRPILYCGSDISHGGHAFIFSGVNEEGRIWVNWGWNGKGDGYFSIADLNPAGILGSSGIMHFNNNQSMIIGFRTDSIPTPDEKFHSTWVLEESYELTPSVNSVKTPMGTAYNMDYRSFDGTVGLYIIKEDGSESLFKSFYNSSGSLVKPYYGTNLSSRSSFGVNISRLSAGTYYVYAASQAVNEEEPSQIRTPNGAIYYIITKEADGTVTVSEQMEGRPVLTGIRQVEIEPVTSEKKGIFSLDGRYFGTDATSLPKGIYIINGKKVVR